MPGTSAVAPSLAARHRAYVALTLALLGAAAVGTPLAAQARPTSAPQAIRDAAADDAALRQRGTEYEAAWAAGDAKALGEMYTPDAMTLGSRGPATMGRAAIVTQLAQSFVGSYKGTTISIAAEPAQFVTHDVAVGHGTYTVRRGSDVVVVGRYMNVWLRSGGEWRMRANQTFVPTPAATPAGGERR